MRQADSDKEAGRGRKGVSKGKIKTESLAEANQEPGAGMRHLPGHSPQVCWLSQLLCPHKDDDRTGRSRSRPMV